jgi:DNA-directed RNA polymerase subunit RPC12/RpoP
MEDGKKKKVMMIIIAACLLVAAALAFFTGSRKGKIPSFEGETVTLLCINPDCLATYEMGMHEYYKYIKEHRNPMSLSAPPMVCEKCQEQSAHKGFKCEKCDNAFLPFAAQERTPDVCPKCGIRVTEK